MRATTTSSPASSRCGRVRRPVTTLHTVKHSPALPGGCARSLVAECFPWRTMWRTLCRRPCSRCIFSVAHTTQRCPSAPGCTRSHGHKLVDLWRRRGRREALHEPLDDLDESDHPAAPDDEQPARRDLGVLLQLLPAAQQQAITLTKIEGLSMVEASARTGVSVAALKVQVHRGLKRLAALVKDDS